MQRADRVTPRPPPKEQAKLERWSLVFFTRPGNTQILRPLADESALIAEAAAKDTEGKFNTGSTSAEWFARRIKNQRIKNRTVRVPSPAGSALAARSADEEHRGRRHGALVAELSIGPRPIKQKYHYVQTVMCKTT